MKVWLDDERKAPEGWIHFTNVEDLIPWVSIHMDEISIMSLDHDLGLEVKTGYDFMCWLEGKIMIDGVKKIPKIKIHSANPVGKKKMKQVLDRINNWV